ncbi:MAG TPA: hypothetical protein VJQ61_05475 [Sinomonas sp.]|nr:hypothetical protein [Sinomonas sp.]
MDIREWWPKLRPETRNWLIEHNGEKLPSGVLLSDEAVDWIEEVANDADPG